MDNILSNMNLGFSNLCFYVVIEYSMDSVLERLSSRFGMER